jgi:hypothetical protein
MMLLFAAGAPGLLPVPPFATEFDDPLPAVGAVVGWAVPGVFHMLAEYVVQFKPAVFAGHISGTFTIE